MKKTQLFVFLLFAAMISFAQADKNPFPKTITVNGSAEFEITPDEIYVIVDLKEYEKKGQGKMSIETIKNNFLKNVKAVGIPDSAVTIAAYDGSMGNPWLRKKNKKNDLLASITYQLKVKNSLQLDALVDRLDDEATQNFFIQRTAHSKIAELRKQLKIAAVKAAKEKAGYLAEAINEKIGDAVTINEPTEYYMPYYNARASNMMMQGKMMENAPDANPVDFTKIKLKYDVTVVFALK